MKTEFRVPKLGVHRPTGQARVLVNGRQVYLGKAGTDEAAERYRRLVAEMAANHGVPPAAPSQALTVSEAMLRYTEHAERYYVRAGKQTAEVRNLKRPIRVLREIYGSLPVAEFSVQHLKVVREALVKAVKREPKEKDKDKTVPEAKPTKPKDRDPEEKVETLGRVTVNQHVARLVRAFRWCAEEGIVPPQVALNLRVLAGLRRGRTTAPEGKPVRPVEWSLVWQTLRHLPRQIRAMVVLQWLTGMRAGEVTQMRMRDLDMSGDVWLYAVRVHKTEHHGKERVIALGPKAKRVLRLFLKVDRDAFLFSPRDRMAMKSWERREARETPLWDSHVRAQERRRRVNPRRAPRDRYDTASYSRAIRRACVEAGVAPWHSHQLRHSAATRIRREAGIEMARLALGHSDPGVTAIYAEADRAKVVELMARLG